MSRGLEQYTERVVEQPRKKEKEAKTTFFPSLEGEMVEENDFNDEWYDYLKVTLSNLEDGETWAGFPVLSDVQTVQWEDNPKPQHRVTLTLVDEEMEERLEIPITLKSDGDIQKNIHHKSKLYAFLASIKDLEEPGWSKKHNRIGKADLDEYRRFLDSAKVCTIKAIEVPARKDFPSYMTFKVVKIQL